MKYSVECRVDSKVFIGKGMKISEGKKEYILIPDKNGMLTLLRIIKKVDRPERFYSKIEEGDKRVKWHITIESDADVVNELRSDFQYLESALSFVGNLKKIYWNEPKRECIPETEKEKSKLKVLSASFRREYPDLPTQLRKEGFVAIVRNKDRFDCLTTLRSFYREGKNLFTQFRYIDAFYNFYFIIEDLFGSGKTKNKQIEESFKASKELKEMIKWVMDTQINSNKEHRESVSIMLREKNLQNTPDDVIRLLIRMRGQLHHYTSQSSLKQPTPLAQMDFRSLAFLIMGIALRSILNELMKINIRHKKQSLEKKKIVN